MESQSAFGNGGISDEGGLLGNSLLENATLSTSLEDNSAYLGLSQALRDGFATDPLATDPDSLINFQSITPLVSDPSSTPNVNPEDNWRLNGNFDSNNLTAKDFLTGTTENTPLVGNNLLDSLTNTSTPSLQRSSSDLTSDVVIEATNETFATTSTQPLILTGPDLIIAGATAPNFASLNETIEFTWTVANIGDTEIVGSGYGSESQINAALSAALSSSGGWYDAIYLSDDQTIDGTDTHLTSTWTGEKLPLGAGESYSFTESIILPNTGIGNRYLILATDAYNYFQDETDEANNTLVLPIEITAPNLIIATATAPTTASLGQTIAVDWTGSNIGNIAAPSPADWYDRVYLSKDSIFDETDIYLSEQQRSTNTSLAINSSYSLTENITIPNTDIGNQYLLLVADGRNQQGETNEGDNVFALPIELTPSEVDLIVESAILPATSAESSPVALTWTVTNSGSSQASTNWYDSIYLSDNTIFDSSDRFLDSTWVGDNPPLAGGESYSVTQNVTLPNRTDGGKWYVLIVTDSYNNQIEANETNNILATPIELTIPDLVVTGATAPLSAVVGGVTPVSWTVKNLGEVEAAGDWQDYVYLSDDAIYDSSDTYITSQSTGNQTPLSTGSEYTLNADIAIPNVGKLGNRYLLFVADHNNYQSETNEANNLYALPINITAPDLITTGATAPTSAGLGETVSVSWNVKNQGDVVAGTDWYDYIYISDDTTYDYSDTFVSSSWTGDQTPLAAQSNYTVNKDIVIPYTKAGDRYLLFISDRDNYQGETNETNNTYATPINIKAPDLIVSDTTTPNGAAPNSTIAVSYTVKNLGDVTANRDWYDYVFLSNDAIYDGSDTYLYNRYTSAETPLAVDGTYTVNANVTLPNNGVGQPGNRYLLFVTDLHNYQYENSETNNVKAVPLTITGQSSDLVVSAATAPSEATVGQQIALSWNVQNQGTLTTSRNDWYDYVYLSNDETLDSADTYISYAYSPYYNSYTPLTTGASYTVNQTITLPTNMIGSKYLLFATDRNNYLGEGDESNNVKALPINIAAPDLIVTGATSPSVVAENAAVSLTWTVKNQGNVTALSNWYDSVYLSDNTTYDSSDRHVGYTWSGEAIAAGASYTKSATFNLPTNSGAGQRYLLFKADDVNYQGETDESNNIAFVPINITIPDLTVTTATAPTEVVVGGTATVSWAVSNTSEVVAAASWNDSVYISDDARFDSSDTYVADFGHSRTSLLAADTSYTQLQNITIPQSKVGDRYLLFITDRTNSQSEVNEANNVYALPVKVTAPDLITSAAIVPIAAGIGETVAVSWTVKNQGDVPASADWYDYVYISDDTTYNYYTDTQVAYRWTGDQTPLVGQGSYTASQNITIPNTKAGDRYLLFISDRDNYQGETNEANNVYAAPLNIHAADLTVSDVISPSVVDSGATIDVAWTVKNQGDVSTINNYYYYSQWYDNVFLSYDAIYDSSDYNLATNYNPSSLAAGATYSINQNATLPTSGIGSPGNRYLIFVTDTYNYQNENSESNNVLAVPLTIAGQNSDLVVSAATAPNDAIVGQQIALSWTVQNQGALTTSRYDWYDEVYLSSDLVLDGTDTRITQNYSGYYNSYSALATGASYTVNQALTLPSNVNGTQYLLFATDRYNYLAEGDESNNVLALGINIAAPDLTIFNATAPLRGYPGNRIEVNWTVKNQGNIEALTDWYDSVYLSDDATFNSSTDTLLKNVGTGNLTPLIAGANYSVTQQLDLPTTSNLGSHYLLFIADSNSSQGETNETNNTRALPIIIGDLDADLTVTTATAPTAAVLGETIAVDWTVTNSGTLASAATWNDTVYLSTDTIWDTSDVAIVSQAGTTPLGVGEVRFVDS